MKYINLFETQAAYDAAEKYYPNVSYIEATDEVVYQEIDPLYSSYLTFEALQNGTFTLTVPANVGSTYMTSISYSVDNGANWTTTTIDNTNQTITTPTINAGSKVLWKGIGNQMGTNTSNYSKFTSTGNFNVSGNVMSLLYGDTFARQTSFASGSLYTFYGLFQGCTKLISAENLALPATTLVNACYSRMFQKCTSLTTAPELPATSLTDRCYQYMFSGCTSLTTAPSILPATTLVQNCYYYMFYNCEQLNSITMLATDISATDCLTNWVDGVAATGTFTKAASMTTLPTGDSGIPSGWTVVEIN